MDKSIVLLREEMINGSIGSKKLITKSHIDSMVFDDLLDHDNKEIFFGRDAQWHELSITSTERSMIRRSV